jgi:dihydroxy-acid dehydratase
LVETGDTVTIDVEQLRIDLDVGDDELARRRDAWTAPPLKQTRGTLGRYIRTVSSAALGCVTDE